MSSPAIQCKLWGLRILHPWRKTVKSDFSNKIIWWQIWSWSDVLSSMEQIYMKEIVIEIIPAVGLAALLSARSHWFLTALVTLGWFRTSVRLITDKLPLSPVWDDGADMSASKQHEQQVVSSTMSTCNEKTWVLNRLKIKYCQSKIAMIVSVLEFYHTYLEWSQNSRKWLKFNFPANLVKLIV